MIFAVPAVLFLLVALPFAATWLIRHAQRARAAALATLGDPVVLARTGLRIDPGSRRVRAVLRTAAIGFGLLALARPQGGEFDTRSNRSGRDLLVALDLSRSMLVQDAGGTRLDRAKTLAKDLADELPGDRVGLVIFGGAAFLQLPMTNDHAVFDRFIDAATTNAIEDPSTDIASALDVSRTVFEHEGGEGHRAIVLLTDGERSEGQPRPAAREAGRGPDSGLRVRHRHAGRRVRPRRPGGAERFGKPVAPGQHRPAGGVASG